MDWRWAVTVCSRPSLYIHAARAANIPSHRSPCTRPLCLQRPPHIVLTLLEGNPTSSTSHCCPVQAANKGRPKGQRCWQTLSTVPCWKTYIVPLGPAANTHLDNQKSQTSALGDDGLFLQQNTHILKKRSHHQRSSGRSLFLSWGESQTCPTWPLVSTKHFHQQSEKRLKVNTFLLTQV